MTRSRLPLLAGSVLGVLLVHALLLAGLPTWGAMARAATLPLSVRQIVPAPADPVADPLLALAGAAPKSPAADADDVPPVFATRLPPAAALHYELRRGLLTGQGTMNWRPGADSYELDIVGTALGLELLSWSSRGGFDSAGLAPLRFVDRRFRRAAQAANFQRGKGVITWAGVTTEVPLLAGAQDRLSWMVQVPAIVEAAPARFVAGEKVPMLVTGARGDADVWTFSVVGVEGVDVVGARIEGALALRREPRKPHDTKVEVWLDPARRHLPVRVKLSSAEGGDGLEFVLKP